MSWLAVLDELLLLLLVVPRPCCGDFGVSSSAAVYSGPAAACTSGIGKHLHTRQQQQQQQ
jgi:hypothetical protein